MVEEYNPIIKALRKKNGLTQEDLAKKIGVTKLTISRWENGDRTPKSDKAKQLADFFGVSVGYLLGYDSDKKDPMLTSFELARTDETGEYADLNDLVTLMDVAMLKSVDTRDKILSNLKNYYDYYGIRMKKDKLIEEGSNFEAFLTKFQADTDDHIIMLLTGIVRLRDDIRFTLLDLLSMEGEKLETVKNVIKFISNNESDD